MQFKDRALCSSGFSESGLGPRGSRYETRVLRSDGASLGYGYKPAPKGTPATDRVLALDDGTDIVRAPVASATRQSFSLAGITRFMRARASGESALTRVPSALLAEVEQHLRRAARLPCDEDYVLLALCVLTSYCQRLFGAVPVVLLHGPPGSGKSQLAAAMAELGCNGVVLSGQTSAATLAREVDRTGGLVIIDDLEQLGTKKGERTYSDLAQLLKVGYKQHTSRKVLTVFGRQGGRTEELDLYGLKVVTNTRGADDVLGSRMLVVPTARLERGEGLERDDTVELQGLRDDLHVFVMESVTAIREAYLQYTSATPTRLSEIAAPLRVLVGQIDDGRLVLQLGEALQRQREIKAPPEGPVELVKRALGNIAAQGFTETFCLFHLQLEVQRLTRGRLRLEHEDFGPVSLRWVGRLLKKENWIDDHQPLSRPRLFGHQTRVYTLNSEFANSVEREKGIDTIPAGKSPLEFCLSRSCDACSYQNFCLLKERKRNALGQLNQESVF